MKTDLAPPALAACVVLASLTGCGTTATDEPSGTSRHAAEATQALSSGIRGLIRVEGKASDSGPGVQECSGKDRDTYFRIFHKWSFYPASASDLDAAMQHLKDGMPEHGWKIVEYGPDTSRNKNLTLVADNDEQKAGVHITQMKKRNPPKLSLMVVSGCYRVPEGQKVEHF
ncbi:hypothetical protein [Streptomyces misionensis]